ncbi:hypothetical protein H5410_057948 [Solanum commersonii]|uniref:Uncharacterized protein n=1 Tax=Solanum commersonii TaxID=4109 RepID=A0A9J5WS95_SOLCO|nr:hypothetical protein H5410_057948 [Solanum commersonii]
MLEQTLELEYLIKRGKINQNIVGKGGKERQDCALIVQFEAKQQDGAAQMVYSQKQYKESKVSNLGIVQRSVLDSSQARYHEKLERCLDFQLHPWLWTPSLHDVFLNNSNIT